MGSKRDDKPPALILCGGRGDRMKPYQDQRHKCLVAVDDGIPLYRRHVELLAKYGFRVHANVPTRWQDAFADVARGIGVKVQLWPEDGAPHGAGTSFLRFAASEPLAHALVSVCGDAWYDEEWYRQARRCIDSARIGTRDRAWVMAASLRDEPFCPGTLTANPENGYLGIVTINEDPIRTQDVPPPRLYSAGMIVYEQGFVHVMIKGLGKRLAKSVGVDLMHDAIPAALNAGARAYACAEFWRDHNLPAPPVWDVGSPSRYARYCVWEYERRSGLRLGSGAATAIETILRAGRVICAGNGGAAAVASHAVIDWQKQGMRDCHALLDVVVLTAWANDHGYAGAFGRQVRNARLMPADALVLFSGSGKSENVVEAAKVARSLGIKPTVIGVTCDARGADLPLARECDVVVRLPYPAPRGSSWTYGPIEDAMSGFVHATACAMNGLSPWKSCMAEGRE